MSAEAFLVATLKNDAGVGALIGSGDAARIWSDQAREGEPLPLIVYEQGEATYSRSLDNALQATQNVFSVTCWAATRNAAELLGNAVVDAMATQAEFPLARASEFDEDNVAYAAVLSFGFWNR